MKVLIAEDEHNIRQGLEDILKAEGYETVTAENGRIAIELYESEKPDFICLDIMMPEMNGYDVCRTIRDNNKDIPVIFISAKSEEVDKVLGLELGADDYILKPFGVKEVIARIRAVTRRYLKSQNLTVKERINSFKMHELEVFPNELRARRGETLVELSLRDTKILSFLFENSGQAIDRDKLFNHCWGRNYLPSSRTLDQHISKLRKRVELDVSNPKIICTVHGFGYRFDP
ncbi:Phosphate regulon transcriptional regulatory protein PhoB (SphR) [hydrothermal vent metagenome]|uniref:Phosphate regulon transcriptional regulatory protein PhoB (SphR) n=1 Tax=hydrothermal vent metagenome TaxID=652676 RepID=A0A3B0YI31_9ZZZZ